MRNDKLVEELESLLAPLGVRVVELDRRRVGDGCRVALAITRGSGNLTVEDCAQVHATVRPRLLALLGARELDLEVSTPGIERALKDSGEFAVFEGRRCRIYHARLGAFLVGTIGPAGPDGVRLDSWTRQDTGETGDGLAIDYEDIGKARLDFKWEERK